MLASMNTPASLRPPSPSYRYYWEDFPVGHVMDLGGTPVTREAVIEFARQFDPQPFHVDEQAAKASVLGGLCASGWHTCAIAMRIMCDGYLLEAASQGSPGMDALRWLKPVFPGDVLRLRMEVLQARPMNSRPHVGLVRSRWEMRNQNEEPVLTMEGWGMFLRRSPGA